ncbi:histone-lysine N-methyltransferase, H3 lysine-9 specific [Acrasis kona]|uniref:Histone-lysine N-methyltransferase, H3 lysine-9 specific n=1 Tax=Acrasis kona TaxID=1008807 RepID=A0AAW2Z3R5_9EUKA
MLHRGSDLFFPPPKENIDVLKVTNTSGDAIDAGDLKRKEALSFLGVDEEVLSSKPSTKAATPNISTPNKSKRKVSLYYITEIAQFSRNEVDEAHINKLNASSGETFGPTDVPVNSTFDARDQLGILYHHNTNKTENNSTPASSLLLLDSLTVNDNGNCALYFGETVDHDPIVNIGVAPELRGINLALSLNVKTKVPVRVIRGRENVDCDQKLISQHQPISGYRYDGIYFVGDYWYEQLDTTTFQYIFKLVRVYGQPAIISQSQMYSKLYPPKSVLASMDNDKPSLSFPQSDTSTPSKQPSPVQLMPQPLHVASNPVYQQPQNHKHSQPVNTPDRVGGLDLNHNHVLDLLNNLREKNSTATLRINNIQNLIEGVKSKSEQNKFYENGQPSGNRDSTTNGSAREKEFTWKHYNAHQNKRKEPPTDMEAENKKRVKN